MPRPDRIGPQWRLPASQPLQHQCSGDLCTCTALGLPDPFPWVYPARGVSWKSGRTREESDSILCHTRVQLLRKPECPPEWGAKCTRLAKGVERLRASSAQYVDRRTLARAEAEHGKVKSRGANCCVVVGDSDGTHWGAIFPTGARKSCIVLLTSLTYERWRCRTEEDGNTYPLQEHVVLGESVAVEEIVDGGKQSVEGKMGTAIYIRTESSVVCLWICIEEQSEGDNCDAATAAAELRNGEVVATGLREGGEGIAERASVTSQCERVIVCPNGAGMPRVSLPLPLFNAKCYLPQVRGVLFKSFFSGGFIMYTILAMGTSPVFSSPTRSFLPPRDLRWAPTYLTICANGVYAIRNQPHLAGSHAVEKILTAPDRSLRIAHSVWAAHPACFWLGTAASVYTVDIRMQAGAPSFWNCPVLSLRRWGSAAGGCRDIGRQSIMGMLQVPSRPFQFLLSTKEYLLVYDQVSHYYARQDIEGN